MDSPKRRLIAAQWADFERIVFAGADIPDIQWREMRRAFYAGAVALFGTLTGGMSEGSEAEPEDLALMDDISSELYEWRERLIAGEV